MSCKDTKEESLLINIFLKSNKELTNCAIAHTAIEMEQDKQRNCLLKALVGRI